MKNSKTPSFISFEGGEGSGKSTQAKKLYEYFLAKGIDAILTREPGGTEVSEKIREILVTGTADKISPKTELLLHYSARIEHLRKVIKPALQQNKIVITDRFFDSTIAYQGYGHGIELNFINNLNDFCIEGIIPNITFIFDIDIATGVERAKARNSDNEKRYEIMGDKFHNKVRKGFIEIANNNPKRCKLINANNSIEGLHQKVISILNQG